MQFKLIILSVLLTLSSLVAADEKKADCGLAIDAADKIVPDPKDDCDYTKTGLNGVLHRALSSKETAENNQPVSVKEVDGKKEISAAHENVENEFSNAQELQVVKYRLLEKAAIKCSKGFVVDAELYIPANKSMTLELVYHCL